MFMAIMQRSALIAAAYMMSVSAYAIADDLNKLNIPAGELSDALKALARQADVEVLYTPAQVKGIHTDGLRGAYSAHDAVRLLLKGTLLQVRTDTTGAMVIALPAPAVPGNVQPGSKSTGEGKVEGSFNSGDSLRPAQADQGVPEKSSSVGTTDLSNHHEKNSRVELEAVVVTGTRIKDAKVASPTVTLSEDQIRNSGQSTLGDAIRTIPQNFNGGVSPFITRGIGGSSNVASSAALNLRGLGPDATLTLLNGHRLSYNGTGQSVDISAIPLDAVQSLQIVPDGSSALYGSDAVGGVANVILKPDYEGISTAARVGGATEGGDFQQQYSTVGGHKWGSGGALFAYEYEHTTPIMSDQRSFTSYMPDPNYLLSLQRRHGLLLTGHQAISEHLTFTLDGLYSRRWSHYIFSTTSVRSEDLSEEESYTIAPSISLNASPLWDVKLSGVYSTDNWHSDSPVFSASGAQTSLTRFCVCDNTDGVEAVASGKVLSLESGDIKVAVGAGYRHSVLGSRSYTSNSSTLGSRDNYYGFGEFYIPLVAAQSHIPAVSDLTLTAAGRYEHYSDFGKVFTPKLGIIYAPLSDFGLKASWGRSFKAPTLLQAYATQFAYLFPAATFGANNPPASATVLLGNGGNQHLDAERAETWSITGSLRPNGLPGFRADVSYFSIQYDGRVGMPIITNTLALSTTLYQDYVQLNPTSAAQQVVISRAPSGLTILTGGRYDPANVLAVVYNYYTNLAKQRISGVDFNLGYQRSIGSGHADFGMVGSYLKSRQQNGALSEPFGLAGTVFHPPHFQGRLSAIWSGGAITIASFLNYRGPVVYNLISPSVAGASMTTADITLRWKSATEHGLAGGLEADLAVENIMNRTPPEIPHPQISVVNYDPTNYSAVGRFVSATLRKTF